MAPYLAASGTARQRFLREARAAAAVSHDHIVTIHAVEAGEALPYLVMEYITGISLQATARSRWAPGTRGDCSHRPSSRSRPGRCPCTRTGPSRHQAGEHPARERRRAREDHRLRPGPCRRRCPAHAERHRGRHAAVHVARSRARGETVDHRSDLFSLGSVLYTLATGFPPFRAGPTMGVLNRIANDPPRPIRETVPEFPAALETIIMQLLEKDPAKRFQLAADVSFKLAGFLSSPPRDSEPVPPDESETEPAEHEEPTKWWVTALCVLAAAAMVAIVLTFKTPKGTLIVEIDDPGIKVALDGEELKITGRPQEVRLKPGDYHVTATKDGKPAKVVPEIVTITKNGKQVVKVSIQPPSVVVGGEPMHKNPVSRKEPSEWSGKFRRVQQ